VSAAKGPLLGIGEPAPDFSLASAAGDVVRLSDFRGKTEVVLFFYPKDETPGCTIEACSFRDSHEAFREAGATVIGVSSDSGRSHRRFADRHGLRYLLLSDADGAVRARYGVTKTLGLLPGRVTFVIDREGILRHVFSSQFRPSRHVEEALGVLRTLRGPEGEGA
jgi:peroxiredoxin Q/BCP